MMLSIKVRRPGRVKKLPVTLGYAVVFSGYFGFLHHLQLASQNFRNMAEKIRKLNPKVGDHVFCLAN